MIMVVSKEYTKEHGNARQLQFRSISGLFDKEAGIRPCSFNHCLDILMYEARTQ